MQGKGPTRGGGRGVAVVKPRVERMVAWTPAEKVRGGGLEHTFYVVLAGVEDIQQGTTMVGYGI